MSLAIAKRRCARLLRWVALAAIVIFAVLSASDGACRPPLS